MLHEYCRKHVHLKSQGNELNHRERVMPPTAYGKVWKGTRATKLLAEKTSGHAVTSRSQASCGLCRRGSSDVAHGVSKHFGVQSRSVDARGRKKVPGTTTEHSTPGVSTSRFAVPRLHTESLYVLYRRGKQSGVPRRFEPEWSLGLTHAQRGPRGKLSARRDGARGAFRLRNSQ